MLDMNNIDIDVSIKQYSFYPTASKLWKILGGNYGILAYINEIYEY
jgi:hypothetical protein